MTIRNFLLLSVGFVVVGLAHSQAGSRYLIDKEDIPKTIKALKSESAKERAQAAKAIGKHGAIRYNDIREAINPLKDLLKKDKDPNVRAAAAQALGNIAPQPKETVKLLIKTLEEKEPQVKMAAIEAIGKMGSAAKVAIPELRKIAQNKDDKQMRRKARLVLKGILGK